MVVFLNDGYKSPVSITIIDNQRSEIYLILNLFISSGIKKTLILFETDLQYENFSVKKRIVTNRKNL